MSPERLHHRDDGHKGEVPERDQPHHLSVPFHGSAAARSWALSFVTLALELKASGGLRACRRRSECPVDDGLR